MRTVQDIVLGVAAQTLVHDALEGRASSVTSVEVFSWSASDDDDAESATTGSPSVETNPNTTTDAAAGASQSDPRRIPVTATTGAAVGRVYLVTDPDGRKEWFETREVDSADALYARHPLHNDYAVGSTVVSTRLSITVDTTWCSDSDNIDASSGPNPMYRARWTYVVGGVTYVADTYFNVVRYAGKHGVSPQDVDNFAAGWLDRLPIDHRVDQGRRLIDEGYREVKIDLAGVRFDDSTLAESEIVDELVRYKTLELSELARYLSAPEAGPERLELATRRYTARLDTFVRLTTKVPVRDPQTGASVAGRPYVGITRR